MDSNLVDDNKLIAVIALLASCLIVVSVLFGMTYFADIRSQNPQHLDIKSCYIKE